MECNKEEAVRAKEIADKKLQNKDYLGAKKFALKAQQLFPDLDNISQMLTVCEVHCCAGAMINGEMDWYRVLQVEQTADEPSIKKQYRKLALLLHPDKNRFAGAEAAFKLIGEAHMTLSDRAKRSIYDMKRRANIRPAIPRQPTQQPNMTSFVRKQPGVQNNPATNPATFHFGNINQQPSVPNYQTFWTMCPSCCMKFQYFRTLLNKALRCARCLTNYTAIELAEEDVPRHSEASNFCSQTQNFRQESPAQGHFGNSSSTGPQGNVAGGSKVRTESNTAHGNGGPTGNQKTAGGATGNPKSERVNIGKTDKSKAKTSAANPPRKRNKKAVVESSDSESSTDSESEGVIEDDPPPAPDQNSAARSSRYPQRSSRLKQNVSYNEGANEDDDFASPRKKLRKSGSKSSAGFANSSGDDRRKKPSGEENLPNGEVPNKCKTHATEKEEIFKFGSRSNADTTTPEPRGSPDIRSFSTPDSEFYDFEKERDPGKFKAGQIWAVYDNLDAMPRFYARIVDAKFPFKVRLTWLEYKPMCESEAVWADEELPVACGNYKHGRSENSKDLQMFSHLILWSKGKKGLTYDIYPRSGEVWAVFKDWDASWSSDPKNHRVYEYEVVEILSDLAEGSDFRVSHLVRVQGFVSLFVRAVVGGEIRIRPAEVLRFSHRVPSYRMSEGEKEGIPGGSFELDTAALPINFAETFPSINLNNASVKAENMEANNSSSGYPSAASKKSTTLNKENSTEDADRKSPNIKHENDNADAATSSSSPTMPPSSPSLCEFVPTDFHDFSEDKSLDKIQKGQIWALYSDIDQYPKFYAKIKKVDTKNNWISISWVDPCTPGKDAHESEVMWVGKGLPVTCGRFKAARDMTTFNTTDTFSHLVRAIPTGSRCELYDIYPRSGEIWAVYKDWDVNWTRANLEKCQYHVVEILERTSCTVRVLVLTKVEDYVAVFMPEKRNGAEHTMEIPLSEKLRFSHQIPAFRLTEEVGGALDGYLELDTASLPNA